MKKDCFVFLLTAFSIIGYSQEAKVELLPKLVDNSIYNTAGIEKKPEYPGGMSEFYKYVAKKYRTPQVRGLQGRIFVTFVVEKDGSITDIKVLKDLGHGTGEEAIRVLQKCKNWIPGEQDGKKVRVLYALPLVIQTQ